MINITIQTTEEQVTVSVQDVPPIPLPSPDKPFWDFKSTLNTTEQTAFDVTLVGQKLPNNAGQNTYFFGDTTLLYDVPTQKLVANQPGAFYLVAISFKAQTSAQNTWVECYLREANGVFEKRPQSEYIVRGSNVVNDMHFLLEYYASPAVFTSGFEIFVRANNNVSIWEIDYTIKLI